MDESTPTDAVESVEPTATDGPKPEPPKEPAKVPDDTYVKSLRKEAAETRKRLEAANARLQEIENEGKSESEKLQARAAESERRASEAEAKLLRVEVAASRNFQASAIPLLGGTTREEIEASADALAAFVKDNETTHPGFDGGARQTPEATKTPEEAHNDWLMRAITKRG